MLDVSTVILSVPFQQFAFGQFPLEENALALPFI
jgi:hypothetical protein